MRGTHGFTFATTQTILDRCSDRADVGLLHDQRFCAHQAKRRRVCVAQIGVRHEFATVEITVRVDFIFVCTEWCKLFFGQKFEFGDADAMFTRNHAVKVAGNLHDARDRFICLLQHVIIVRIHGDVGVHIAVTCVHVQGDKYAAAQDFFVDLTAFIQNLVKRQAGENAAQLSPHFALVRQANGAVL